MATQLRSTFRISNVSHCKDFLKVLWGDGIRSNFPNNWLRTAVREPMFYDPDAYMFKQPRYVDFLANPEPLLAAERVNGQGEEELEVKWEDHSARLNSSWLRAQDHNGHELAREPEPVLWDANSILPGPYQYAERFEKQEQWLTDLRKYGWVYFQGVPPTPEGMHNVSGVIGMQKQRGHPVNYLPITVDPSLNKQIDHNTYSKAYHPLHNDSTYYKHQPKLTHLLGTLYDAPNKDTHNLFCDSLMILKDLQENDPESYELLKTVKIVSARRRINVQEECKPEDEHLYHAEAINETTVIEYDEDEGLPSLRIPNHHAGYQLAYNQDHSKMPKYYKALKKVRSMLDDPKYHQKVILKPGTMALFSNQRTCHGRESIDDQTKRSILLAFTDMHTFRRRWRFLLGDKSGLDPKWLYGCTQPVLRMLSNRFEAKE